MYEANTSIEGCPQKNKLLIGQYDDCSKENVQRNYSVIVDDIWSKHNVKNSPLMSPHMLNPRHSALNDIAHVLDGYLRDISSLTQQIKLNEIRINAILCNKNLLALKSQQSTLSLCPYNSAPNSIFK